MRGAAEREASAERSAMAAAPGPDGVQEAYTTYAAQGGDGADNWAARAKTWGYAPAVLESLGLEGAERRLFAGACGGGCPLRVDGGPRPGETVFDLGCGFGHDLVLASRMTRGGRVVGVDVTAAMLDAAARTVAAFSLPNVELRRAALDDPSLGSGVADVVASNGVFNLTRDKRAAFAAAFRLLKPGGRLLLADVCKTGAPAS